MTAENGGKARRVQAMFSRIAGRYDLMNALMTFGLHSRWRAITVRAALAGASHARGSAAPPEAAGERPSLVAGDACRSLRGDAESPRMRGGASLRPLVLDAGTGTADLALAAAGAGAPRVIGIDFSDTMLLAAIPKLAQSSSGDAVCLLAADAMRLPFADDTFDCVVNGFVLRNVADLPATVAEFRRVLRPGGRLACLDLTHPPRLIAPAFRPYFEGVVPLAGRIIAGDAAAYRYLPDSVHPFPDVDRLAAILREAGFSRVSYRRLGLGIVALHIGAKPAAGAEET